MKAIRLGLLAIVYLFSSTSVFAQTSSPPGGVSSGLVLWLDANDVNGNGSNPATGANLSTWKDKSGAGHNATSFATNQPKFKTNMINGLPTVTFTKISQTDGTGFTVPGVDIRAMSHPQVTIFTVYRQSSNFPSMDQAVWGDDNGGWDRFFFTKFSYGSAGPNDGGVSFGPTGPTTVAIVRNSGTPGQLQLLTACYNGTVTGSTNLGPTNGSAIYFNGKVVTTFTDNTHPSDAQVALKIGLDGDDNFFDGEIAEMIVYDRQLTDCEIQEVNHYLSAKYGAGYDVANNYNYLSPYLDIKGVGNFSTSCITNVITSASSSIVTISNPAVTDINNNLTFANDGSALGVANDQPSAYKARLSRLWRVDETGDVGTVDICFDLSGLGLDLSNTDNFALLIGSSTGMSSATASSITPTITGNKVCFSGVTLSKGQYFTITVLKNAPTATITGITDDTGISATDFITSDATLVFSGTATANSTVSLKRNSSLVATVQADASGNWTYDYTATSLAEGSYTFSVTATLNTISGPSSSVTVVEDRTAPAAPPAISLSGGGRIKTGTPTVTGTTEPNATVDVYSNGVKVGTVQADGTGQWSYTFSPALADGSYDITAKATDVAGNTSPASVPTNFIVDTKAPTVIISTPEASVNAPFTATIKFSELVGELTLSGITSTNATLSGLSRINDSTYTVIVTPTSAGQVSLSIPAATVNDLAGNGNLVSNSLTVQASTAVTVDMIFPVPARNVLNIRFTGVPPIQGRAILIDMAGQHVFDQTVPLHGQLLTIDVSTFASGTYVLKVLTDGYQYSTKIIITHQK